MTTKVYGNIVDIFTETIFKGFVELKDGRILNIERCDTNSEDYILPGFIDAHVHIESSMLAPSRFAEIVIPRGTVGVVADPHEIANVCGTKGVDYMIENAKDVPLKCFFGAPSCVPATGHDSNGATIDAQEIDKLLAREDIWFLSEMMNYPGVIARDSEVMAKIDAANKHQKPIDGHAPNIIGSEIEKYACCGITTDHECSTVSEALHKIEQGMKIQIREGSAAKNFDALQPLFNSHPSHLMLCTDDSHPDEIIHNGHIDKIIRKGVQQGVNVFSLIKAASMHIVQHYDLPVGLLQVGDRADFIVVDNLVDFNVKQTYIDGNCVYDGELKFTTNTPKPINHFVADKIDAASILVQYEQGKKVKLIDVKDGDLLTSIGYYTPDDHPTYISPDPEKDILKIVLLDRYTASKPSVAFIRNVGIKHGAFATTVAHDSHNIIAVGTSDAEIVSAINTIITAKGGLCIVDGDDIDVLELDIAGLMSTQEPQYVADKYQYMNAKFKQMGAKLASPFMTISFMSLLVIPQLKIGNKGLFDVSKFEYTSLFE